MAGYDIAVDCCDNYSTRYVLCDATLKAGIPMVYGAVREFMGQASVLNYRGGPTYRDLYPEDMLPEREERSVAPGVGSSVPPGVESSAATGVESSVAPGVTGPLPGIIGAVQACEVIKIITGAGEILSGRLFQADMLNNRIDIITL